MLMSFTRFSKANALSIRGDEAEEAWHIIEPIKAAWSAGRAALAEYAAADSRGPEGGTGRT
jgi:glucose-6-phosphate 1-dehydrogenase